MTPELDIQKWREEFPILLQKARGQNLVYLDNAATTQKPKAMLASLQEFYSQYYGNVHRAVHFLSEKSTLAYEGVREKIREWINASATDEIVFVKGATDGLNLVANTFAKKYLSENDEVLISAMEHHSNIVPWQMVCEEKKAKLKIIPINEKGELILDQIDSLLTPKTKIVSLVHVSNSLGTINPIETIIKKAHAKNIPVCIDGAQSVSHLNIDVQKLGCDFFVFSAHKFYGPTGVGIVYGKKKWLDALPPYQGGGDMIHSVTFEKTTYNVAPHKFEAGTPNIADVVAFGATLDFLKTLDWEKIQKHEADLLIDATEKISKIKEIKLIGTAEHKASVLSFVIDTVHPHDIGTMLDQRGIAIRAGHHCTQPLMDFYKLTSTARASFAFYNTFEEVDKLVSGIKDVIKFFR